MCQYCLTKLFFQKLIIMDFYDPFSAKPKIEGFIKVKDNTKYAYFSMKLSDIQESFQNTIRDINENLKKKNIMANVSFCSFGNHDGEVFYFYSIYKKKLYFKALTSQYGWAPRLLLTQFPAFLNSSTKKEFSKSSLTSSRRLDLLFF